MSRLINCHYIFNGIYVDVLSIEVHVLGKMCLPASDTSVMI